MNNIFTGILSSIFTVAQNDAPVPWQMSFQEAATPIMEGIISLHNDIMGIILFITIKIL